MANSSTVNDGDTATAEQYNNLREDVLDTSTGHVHDGSGGRKHTNNALVVSGNVKFDAGSAVTAGDYSAGRDADGTNQLHLNVPTGASIELSIQDVVKALLNATGLSVTDLLTVTGGLTLTGALTLNSGQVVFPATQNASANANTLDDYEEGTWTSGIADDSNDGSGEGQTYTQQAGTYVKIGKVVHFWGVLEPSSLGTLTTTQGAKISGFPFVGGDVVSGVSGNLVVTRAANLALPVAGQNITGYMAEGTSLFTLELWDATTGTSPLLLSEFSADGAITFFGSYII